MLLVAMILLAVVLFLVLAALVQWLWNTTIPDVIGWAAVSYWQAVRLLLLALILFGSGGGGMGAGMRMQ